MGKVTIQDIAVKLVAQNGLSRKEATLFVNMMFDMIRDIVERDKLVKVKGLGTFKIIDVDSRESVNVNTGERVLIEGHNKISFTPDVLMKELVNKPFSQFETIVLNEGVDFKDTEKEEEELKADASDMDENEGEMGEMPLVDFASDEAEPKPIELGALEKTEISEKPENLEKPEILATDPEPAGKVETPAESDASAESEVPAEEKPNVEELADLEEGEEESASKFWMLWLLACLLALGIGYLLGNYFPFQGLTDSKETVAPQVEKVVSAKPVTKPVEPVAEPIEVDDEKTEAAKETKDQKTAETEKEIVESEAKKQEATSQKQSDAALQKQSETKPAEAKASEVKAPETKVPEGKLDKYEMKDARVKNGAYRIVGTASVEKVREGDNLQRICKRTLGPGMECYIEVYNDINAATQLKKGMEIKIPKVEWKRKKKAQK